MIAIKACREKAGLAQVAVAGSIGVTQATVSQWERGVTAPRYARLRELAALFQCSVDELINGGVDDASENN